MAFLYEYMNDDELDLARENAIMENEMIHMNNDLQVIMMEHEVRLHDIETKCILENYDIDHMTEMYEREYILYTEGVKEIWEKFKAWISGIVNAILGKTKPTPEEVSAASSSENSDNSVELPGDPDECAKAAHSIAGVIKDFMSGKFKKADGTLDTTKIAISGAVTLAGIGGIGAIGNWVKDKLGKPTKKKISELPEVASNLEGAVKDIGDAVKSVNPNDGDDVSVIQSLAQKVINKLNEIKNFIKSTLAKLTGKGSGSNNNPNGEENKGEQNNGENKDGEQNGNGNGGENKPENPTHKPVTSPSEEAKQKAKERRAAEEAKRQEAEQAKGNESKPEENQNGQNSKPEDNKANETKTDNKGTENTASNNSKPEENNNQETSGEPNSGAEQSKSSKKGKKFTIDVNGKPKNYTQTIYSHGVSLGIITKTVKGKKHVSVEDAEKIYNAQAEKKDAKISKNELALWKRYIDEAKSKGYTMLYESSDDSIFDMLDMGTIESVFGENTCDDIDFLEESAYNSDDLESLYELADLL